MIYMNECKDECKDEKTTRRIEALENGVLEILNELWENIKKDPYYRELADKIKEARK